MRRESTITATVRNLRNANPDGFTLIEMMIGIVVGAVAMLAVYTVYASVSRTYTVEREVAHMQQNLRAAMFMIKNDIRNTGRNGKMNGESEDAGATTLGLGGNPYALGIVDVGFFNGDIDDPAGYPGITMRGCIDGDTPPDGKADRNRTRTISYRVFDADGDGCRELRRFDDASPAPSWELVFDGIEDIGFAYAYDIDNDLELERVNLPGGGPGPVIWAMNTDANPALDTNADNVPDGNVDILDDGNGDGLINTSDGNLAPQIPLRNIRAVRIWLLARSRRPYPDYVDINRYVIGRKVLDMGDPANANRNNFRHVLLTGAVAFQNYPMQP